jgi:hypothetical protein
VKFSEYVQAGWKLCGIARGKKAPVYEAWNTKPIPPDAVDGLDGAGLLHALSGTAALDIDDLDAARPWLAERDIDVDSLLAADDAVRIASGRPGRAKLLYRMKRPLRTVQPAGSGLELRCATGTGSSVQDVLPPTIHPDTQKPYIWEFGILGDWHNLPVIPPKLLTLWQELANPIEQPQPVEEGEVEQPKPVNLDKLRKAVNQHNPNCEEAEWSRVMRQCNDATCGSDAGLDILDEWSKKATRDQEGKPGVPVYPGRAAIKARYKSYQSTPGKLVSSGDALLGEVAAEPDDFEDVPPEITEAEPIPVKGASARRKAALEALMKRYVFVIWEQMYFDTHRHAIIGDKAIRHMETSKMPYKNSRLVDPIDELMKSAAKDQVEALAFHPGETSIFEYDQKRYANTYTDRGIVPIEPMKDELEKIDWLFNRIDDDFYRDWIKQFFAHVVQHPGIKIRTAPLIWSEVEGNGKSTIVGRIPQLLVGVEYYSEVSQGELNSDHNDFLIGKWCISLAEFRAGSRGERDSINKKVENWIADNVLAVHPKGTKGYCIPNHLVVTASSNKHDAALIGVANRKWAVHHFKINGKEVPEMTEQEKYWLFEQFLNTDRAPAVLRHYFLHYPITTFNPHASAPKTASRQAMIDASTTADKETLIVKWEQQDDPLHRDIAITAEVGEWVRKNCIVKPLNQVIGKMLTEAPFNGVAHTWRFGDKVYRGIILRNVNHWKASKGKEIMAHLAGDDVSLDAKDDLLL